MKNLIALTACLKKCSVAISYNDKIYSANEETDAAANLAAILQQLMQANNIDIRTIDGIITASGPGSFTGIRTAQSLAKSIAMVCEIPAVSVDYFTVIERIAASKSGKEESKNNILKNYLIVIKSEKNQAYFKKNVEKKAAKTEISELIGVSSYENILANAAISSAEKNGKFAVIGDAVAEIREYVENNPIISSYVEISDFRDAKYLLNFSELLTESSKITPLYINAAANGSCYSR